MSSLTEKISSTFQPSQPVPLLPPRAQAIPRPFPPVAGPTPDELNLKRQTELAQHANRQNELISRDLEVAKSGEQGVAARAKGLFGAMAGFATRAVANATASVSHSLLDSTFEADKKNFFNDFPSLAEAGAVFVAAYWAEVVHQTAPRVFSKEGVTIYLCSSHLCLCGPTVKDQFPLRSVAAVIPCVVLRTAQDGSAAAIPYLHPRPDPSVVVSALDENVYLNDKGRVMLLSVADTIRHSVAGSSAKMRPVDALYNTLDHAWRAVANVPK